MQAEKVLIFWVSFYVMNKRIPLDILLNMVICYCVTNYPKTQQFKIPSYFAFDIESIIWEGLNWACFVCGLSYMSSDMAEAGHLPPGLGRFRQLGLEHLGSWNISLFLCLCLSLGFFQLGAFWAFRFLTWQLLVPRGSFLTSPGKSCTMPHVTFCLSGQ